MNIKELIGQRIQSARKAKGLTQAELAVLAGELKQPRINNWERGIRTPGPQEIKQLAEVLDVSPAYLMCLTERQQIHPLDKEHVGALIPILNFEQAIDPKATIADIMHNNHEGDISFTPINQDVAKLAGEFAFALKMNDDSMEPELKVNDLIIVCPDYNPKPGNLVLANIGDKSEIIIRRYKLISISKPEHQYELLATNKHWPDIQNGEANNCRILGVVICIQRLLIS